MNTLKTALLLGLLSALLLVGGEAIAGRQGLFVDAGVWFNYVDARGSNSYVTDEAYKARKEAENIVAKARTEIERERDTAIDEVRREFVDLTIKAAEKVVKETLDKEKHRRLIEDVLEQASKGDG